MGFNATFNLFVNDAEFKLYKTNINCLYSCDGKNIPSLIERWIVLFHSPSAREIEQSIFRFGMVAKSGGTFNRFVNIFLSTMQ